MKVTFEESVCKFSFMVAHVFLHSASIVTQQADMSLPMYCDRRDTPLPDRPYNDALGDAENRLKQKEKGPWNDLSKEEKLACLYFVCCSKSVIPIFRITPLA